MGDVCLSRECSKARLERWRVYGAPIVHIEVQDFNSPVWIGRISLVRSEGMLAFMRDFTGMGPLD